MRHRYAVAVDWSGATTDLRSYRRDHRVSAAGVPAIAGSSDPAFRGDPARWNPEQLLVASLSQCHMLWYLALCAEAGVVVVAYHDDATGEMEEEEEGSGQFASVTLRPLVTTTGGSDPDRALSLHDEVGRFCFITRSVAFPVHHLATIVAT